MEPHIYLADAAPSPPTPPESPASGYPTDGNPIGGQKATIPGAWWIYKIGESLRRIIVAAGNTPSDDDLNLVKDSIIALSELNGLPVGSVIPMGGDVVPLGFFKRNGATVSRTTYSRHWSWVQLQENYIDQAVKDSDPEFYAGFYGSGDGSTTYTLPDDRGDFHRSWDDGRGVDPGRVLGSHQSDELKSHSHTIGGFINLYENAAGSAKNPLYRTGAENTSSVGGSETRSKNTALMYIEKY